MGQKTQAYSETEMRKVWSCIDKIERAGSCGLGGGINTQAVLWDPHGEGSGKLSLDSIA